VVLHSIFPPGGNFVETTREKAGKEETTMSPVSWSELCLLVWEQGGFPRGGNVALNASTLNLRNNCLRPCRRKQHRIRNFSLEAYRAFPATVCHRRSAPGCGRTLVAWYRSRCFGHLSQQLRTDSVAEHEEARSLIRVAPGNFGHYSRQAVSNGLA
jgi:hypothetical protein